MPNENKTLDEFVRYIKSTWILLAGIPTLFPIANILLDKIPLPKDFYGNSTAPIANPLTTVVCIFIIYYSFVKGIDCSSKNRLINFSFNLVILGVLCIMIFLLLSHFEYPIRVWLSNSTGLHLDSTDDYVLMMVGIIPFYISFFASLTRAFAILALIDLKRKREI